MSRADVLDIDLRCEDYTAESLPFEDQSFDAAMDFATIDHWQDTIMKTLIEQSKHQPALLVLMNRDAAIGVLAATAPGYQLLMAFSWPICSGDSVAIIGAVTPIGSG